MFPYLNTKKGFLEDFETGKLITRLERDVKSILDSQGVFLADNEIASWRNSLAYMYIVLSKSEAPDDIIVGIEGFLENSDSIVYNNGDDIRAGDKRADFFIAGKNGAKSTIILFELKQWSAICEYKKGKASWQQGSQPRNGELISLMGANAANSGHPVIQILKYKEYLENKNVSCKNEPDNKIELKTCVFMHNLLKDGKVSKGLKRYEEAIKEKKKQAWVDINGPEKTYETTLKDTYKIMATNDRTLPKEMPEDIVFYLGDIKTLSEYITKTFPEENGVEENMKVITNFKNGMPAVNYYLPEKISAIDKFKEKDLKQIAGLEWRGNKYGNLPLLRGDQRRTLAKLMNHVDDIYTCNGVGDKESTPVIVHGGPGSGKTLIAFLLQRYCEIKSGCKGAGSYFAFQTPAMLGTYADETKKRGEINGLSDKRWDLIILDEANVNTTVEDLEKIKHQSRLAVFLFDEKQQMDVETDLSGKAIRKSICEVFGVKKLEENTLVSQFRCNNDEGYLSWVDYILQIDGYDETLEGGAPWLFDFDISFVKLDPQGQTSEYNRGIINKMLEEEKDNKFKSVCNWGVKKTYNALAYFREDDEKFIEVGAPNEMARYKAIQGIEGESIFVYMGDDVKVENDKVVTYRYSGNEKLAQVKESKSKRVKNIYRVLLTRGMKKCYVYCEDDGLRERMEKSLLNPKYFPSSDIDEE